MKAVINNCHMTIAKTWKQAKHLSVDEWIKKIYTYANLVIYLYTYKDTFSNRLRMTLESFLP